MELRKTMKQIHLTEQQLREVANEIGVTIPHAEKALFGSPVGGYKEIRALALARFVNNKQ